MPNISSEIIQDGDFPNISLFKRKLDSCLEDSSQGGSKISTDDPFLSHYSLDCSVNYALSPRADGLNIILESLDIEIPDSSFDSLSNSTILPRLHDKFKVLNSSFRKKTKSTGDFTPTQLQLLSSMLCYRDILFPLQTLKNSNEIRLLFSLHALNHILKTRTVILENNQLLEDASKKDPLAVECEYRDQGFTRPTVLIITPFRENAFEIASSISSLTGFKQVENKKKFNQDYHDDTVSELISKKSADFDATFKGNIDDCFKFGIRISRNSCKIYSDFYSSDILIASPLALRMLEQDPKKESFDFLSSIEIVMVDSCDVLNMQNWDHVQFIFNNLNKIPKESHDTDFSRVKRFWLDQNGSKLRQTIFSSRYMFPDLNNLTSSLSNIAGRIKFSSSTKPAVSKIVNQIPQSFYKINSKSIKDCDDDRFNFFRDKLLTQISNQPKTIVFIPSYFDFVRVRNYLKESLYSFAQLSEYSTPQNISRSRLNFFQGKVKILIVSERFHFFKRYNLRGCHHICFYGLPDRQDFYQDFVDGIDIKESIDATCNVLFTKYDRLKLERIVGVARCEKMIEDGSKEAFLIT